MNYFYRCIVVPDSYSQLARQLASSVSQEASNTMWTIALSFSGELPASHRISSGFVEEDLVNALSDPSLLSSISGTDLVTCIDFLDSIYITEEESYYSITQLNLKLIDYTLDIN